MDTHYSCAGWHMPNKGFEFDDSPKNCGGCDCDCDCSRKLAIGGCR